MKFMEESMANNLEIKVIRDIYISSFYICLFYLILELYNAYLPVYIKIVH